MKMSIPLHLMPTLGMRGATPPLAGFQTLTAVIMKSSVLWDITPCSLFKVSRLFGGTSFFCRLSLLIHADFLLGLFFEPEDGGDLFLRNVS
jgi:hypothetical protein